MAKVDRKKLLKEPDEFLSISDKAIRWAKENARLLIIVVAALVLAVACTIGIQAYLRYRTIQGAEALAKVFPSYQATIVGQADDAAVKKVIADLDKVVEEYGATPSGMQARLALAGLLLKSGDPAKAAFHFSELGDDPGAPAQMIPLALRGLGQCLSAQKKYAEAAAVYGRAAEGAGPQTAALIRLDQGLALAAAGDKSGAAQVYRGLIHASPDSPAASEATSRLVALGFDPQAQ